MYARLFILLLGGRDFPIPSVVFLIIGIGTTSCVTNQRLNVCSTLHPLDFPLPLHGFTFRNIRLRIHEFPRTPSFCRDRPAIIMADYPKFQVVSVTDVERTVGLAL